MRRSERFPEAMFPSLHPLALFLAGLTPMVWGVAALALGLTLLVPGVLILALSALLALVLAPVVLACQSWPGWHWRWLCRPNEFREQWSWWLWRSWLRWPWMCWRWLRA